MQVNPTTASTTNVSGTASLAGTVAGHLRAGQLCLAQLHDFDSRWRAHRHVRRSRHLRLAGRAFGTSLSYTGNTAVLNLRAQLVPEPDAAYTYAADDRRHDSARTGAAAFRRNSQSTPPLPTFTVNQLNVGHAIDNFFNNGGALPPAFVPLFGLTGSNLTTALDQLSGEAATGAQKVAFQLTDQFLNLMLDPFVDGRSGVGGADHPALGFAPERDNHAT